ncbi:hypothetical protein GC170_12000 [bacterium]|nr:hypothetical protein [bacterium]
MVRLLAFLILTGASGAAMAQEGVEDSGPVDRTGANPSTPVRRPGGRDGSATPKGSPFADPRRWLFLAVVGFLAIGGGRKWLHGRKGRALADKMADGNASVEEIRQSHRFGRIVVHDLFRVLTEDATPDRRRAALEALVRLWKADELIPEEEKAIVTRSFMTNWQIRRKYPRGLSSPLTIRVDYGLPETGDQDLDAWIRQHLEWSHRLTGTRRASDDQWRKLESPKPGSLFEIIPADFPEDGPHRLILHPRMHVRGLTDNWQLDLPAQTTSFEWDDHLQTGALKGMPDSTRASQWREMLRVRSANASESDPVHTEIDDRFALSFPPEPMISFLRPGMPHAALPCDLAHQVFLEFESVDGRWCLGEWILASNSELCEGDAAFFRMPQKFRSAEDAPRLERAGTYRGRFVLEPRPELGWSDPAIRSVWPESITTGWFDVEVVRK